MFRGIQKRIDDFCGIICADLFISVGEACRPAHYLSKFHLRKFSSPFDWMMSYALRDIIHFLQNNGDDFFAKIQEIRKDETAYSHRFIKDCQTGMVSMHDFPRNKSIEDYHPEFIAKYKRRFANLKDAILNSKHIVFVGNRDDNLQEIQTFLDEMQKIHTAKYTFINVRHSKNFKMMRKRTIVGGGELYH